ncbi:MAG: hypothetical protein HOP31_00505 [Ignavibacteria bacterium]|nr:hypothetical protein [Ignavibacteria bacterium]
MTLLLNYTNLQFCHPELVSGSAAIPENYGVGEKMLKQVQHDNKKQNPLLVSHVQGQSFGLSGEDVMRICAKLFASKPAYENYRPGII